MSNHSNPTTVTFTASKATGAAPDYNKFIEAGETHTAIFKGWSNAGFRGLEFNCEIDGLRYNGIKATDLH
jgi:hypothetical protein